MKSNSEKKANEKIALSFRLRDLGKKFPLHLRHFPERGKILQSFSVRGFGKDSADIIELRENYSTTIKRCQRIKGEKSGKKGDFVK